jgi:hypothetical protein
VSIGKELLDVRADLAGDAGGRREERVVGWLSPLPLPTNVST